MSLTNASRVTAAETISAAANGTSAGAKALGAVKLVGPGGAQVAAELGAIMSKRAVLLEAATLLGRASLPVGLALAAVDVYQAIRARRKADGTDGIEHDPGQPKETATLQCGSGSVSFAGSTNGGQGWCGSSVAAAAAGYVSAWNATMTAPVRCEVGVGGQPDKYGARVAALGAANGANGYWIQLTDCGVVNAQAAQFSAQPSLTTRCPAVVDPFDPSKSIPAGTSAGADGKCQTGRYTVPMTAQEAADLRLANEAAQAVDYAGLLREAAGLGPVTLPDDTKFEITPASVSPAKVTGATTTTTNPDGTTTTEETEWNFAGLGASTAPFPGGTMPTARAAWKESVTTTTKTASGQTVGTPTTKTTTPGTTGTTQAGGTTSSADPCAAGPGRLGCIGLGAAPTETTPKRTATLTFSEESVSLPAGCPAPRNVMGKQVSWEPICEVATKARPFLLAGAAFSALLLVLATLRGGS